MNRRDVLATMAALGAGSLAGCANQSPADDQTPTETATASQGAPFEHPGTLDERFVTNGDYPPDENPADGVPPQFPDPPADPAVDAASLETLDVNGESVRLAPLDVVEAWYRRGDARFVDARGLDQYRHSNIYGSVLSPAQRHSVGGGIDDWPTEARIVTYCGCPHHLSSIRAAGLQKAGYTNVYAFDDGFRAWAARAFPMAGTSFETPTETQESIAVWTIEGSVDARYAGEYAWARVDRQYEAAPIQSDGRFTLHLAFTGVTDETPVDVSTPAFTVTRPLGTLVNEGV